MEDTLADTPVGGTLAVADIAADTVMAGMVVSAVA